MGIKETLADIVDDVRHNCICGQRCSNCVLRYKTDGCHQLDLQKCLQSLCECDIMRNKKGER